MATLKYPGIPDPSTDPTALRSTAMAMKETIEVLTAQRGNRANAAVTWQDLVDLRLITPAQIPPTPKNQ
jgi:hypothetical protein